MGLPYAIRIKQGKYTYIPTWVCLPCIGRREQRPFGAFVGSKCMVGYRRKREAEWFMSH